MTKILLLLLVGTALALEECAPLGSNGKSRKRCEATLKNVEKRAKYEGGNGCYFDKKLGKKIRKYDKMIKTWQAGGFQPPYERPATACLPMTCDLFHKKKAECTTIGAANVVGECKYVKSKTSRKAQCVPGKLSCKELEGKDQDTCEKSGIECYYHRPTKACRDVPGTPPCAYFGTNERLCKKVVHDDGSGKKAKDLLKLCKMSNIPETVSTCIDFADPPENCHKLNGRVCRESKRCAWYRPNQTCYANEKIPVVPICDHFTKYAGENEMRGDEVVRIASRSDCKQRANSISGLSCDWNYETDACEAVGSFNRDNLRPCERKPRRRCLKDVRCRWTQGKYEDVGMCYEIDDLENLTCSFFTKYVNDLAGNTKECRSRGLKMKPALNCYYNPTTKECTEQKDCSIYTNNEECRRHGCKFKRGTCRDA